MGVGRGMLYQPSHTPLLMGVYFIQPSQVAIQQNISGPLAISFILRTLKTHQKG